MVGEHLQAILKNAQAKQDKDGYHCLPEGTTATLYVAHNGVGLTVSRVEAVRFGEGGIVHARTTKRESFALELGDLYAAAVEGLQGTPARRAGFG
jgi:hypothetical protein